MFKDLRILLEKRKLEDLIIVDNRADSFSLHYTNGIPIVDYNGDKSDSVLYELT